MCVIAGSNKYIDSLKNQNIDVGRQVQAVALNILKVMMVGKYTIMFVLRAFFNKNSTQSRFYYLKSHLDSELNIYG